MALYCGPEDLHGPVSELRKHVMDGDRDALLALLNTLRAHHPTDFIRRDSKNRTALHAACGRNVNPVFTRILLNPDYQMYGGYPDDRNCYLETALINCARCTQRGFDDVVRNDSVVKARMLLEHGASVRITGNGALLPLYWAASVEMVNLLFLHGAAPGINKQKTHEGTMLLKCVASGDVALCKLLLRHGADIKLVSRDQPFTHNAIRMRRGEYPLNDNFMNVDMLELVLKNGSDINALDWNGNSVSDLARELPNRYAVRLIELITAELPIEMEKWSEQNLAPMYQSVRMSQHPNSTRGGTRKGLCRMPIEIIDRVIHHIEALIPTNFVPSAMESIKNRNNGRFPIQDTDYS
jgi:ankyrin repeat protein